MPLTMSCANVACAKTFEISGNSAAETVRCPFCNLEQAAVLDPAELETAGGSPAAAPAPTKHCPHCGSQILAVAKKCRYCGKYLVSGPLDMEGLQGSVDDLRQEHKDLNSQRRRDSWLSILIGLPGFVMLSMGQFSTEMAKHDRELARVLPAVTLLGLVMLIAGFAFGAKQKGRSPMWGLVGFVGCFGLIFLHALKDESAKRIKEIEVTLADMGQSLKG